MLDIKQHKFFLLQILRDIYSEPELASSLAFKGGTALMLFHQLPRFSVDLDFNLITDSHEDAVYASLRNILQSYGALHDEAKKHHGMLFVLNYQAGERNVKVEISSRLYPDENELRDYLGISMQVMQLEYMFTHKFMALLDRSSLTNRDVFDCWFCMKQRLYLRQPILDMRLPCNFEEYIDRAVKKVEKIPANRILNGIGDLLQPDVKRWAKPNLTREFVALAQIYKELPLIR